MRHFIFLFLIFSSTQLLAAKSKVLNCKNSGTQNSLNVYLVDESNYLSHQIDITGEDLVSYLRKPFTNILNGYCEFNNDQEFCSVKVHKFHDGSFAYNGRFEKGVNLFSDFNGMKLEITNNGESTDKNWWFDTCESF